MDISKKLSPEVVIHTSKDGHTYGTIAFKDYRGRVVYELYEGKLSRRLRDFYPDDFGAKADGAKE